MVMVGTHSHIPAATSDTRAILSYCYTRVSASLMILMLCYSGQTGRSRCGLTLLRRVKLTPRKQKLRLVAQSLAELPSHSLKPDNIKYEGLWYKVKVKRQCRLMWVLSLAITGVRPGNGLGLGWEAGDNQGSQCNCRVQIVWDYEPFQTVERPCFTCILLYRRSTIWNVVVVDCMSM